ncbi:ParB/RepB/Spo0J family partition protein [Planctomicrobium sp. SH661]|uniref:ParB/RepB/Spo0J family partition protein n=1 Tax=Planctomicrobium sp. SH661 TaxID=3448124 RepID=UPI003F5B90BE
MATATAKRTPEKSAAPTAPKPIQLRIEKRLKWSGFVTISHDPQQSAPWSFSLDLLDLKLVARKEGSHYARYASEPAAIAAAFREAIHWMWQTTISKKAGFELNSRGTDIAEQLGNQAQQILGSAADQFGDWSVATVGRIPETQAEAAAKEAEFDEHHRPFPLIALEELIQSRSAMELTQDKIRKPVSAEDRLWIAVGSVSSGRDGMISVDYYEVVPASTWQEETVTYADICDDADRRRESPEGFYHGQAVTCGTGKKLVQYVLKGPEYTTPGYGFGKIDDETAVDALPPKQILPDAPEKKSKAKSKQAAPTSGEARHIETLQVELYRLVAHPLNPRSGDVDLDDLVKSLQNQGQLIEAIGRPHPTQPGMIELLAGHRRRAAALKAGWETLRVRIVEATDQQAIEILGRDNEDRKNFTALERARWYQSMLDTLGCSQRDLAKRLGEGHSQGSIANHLVLIKLPDELQELVTTHVISATHARCLATWLDRPAVIAQVQKDLQADVKNREGNGWEPISVPKFEALVNESVRRVSRPTAQGQYHDNCPFRVTDKNRDALDILEVPRSWGGTEKRAFNLTLYSQLSKEAKAKAKQKQKAASPSAPAENEKPAAATYDEHAVAQAKEKWLCLQLAEAVAKLPKKDRLTPLKLFVTLSGTEAMYDVISNRTLMSTVLGIELEESPNRFLKTDQLWQYLEKHEAADLDRVIRNILTQLFGKHPDSGCTDLFDDVFTLLQLCSMLGIDYATDWRPDAEVLAIYPLSLLKDLPASKRIECDDIANFKELSASKEMLIPALLAEWMPGEFPPGLEPV